MTPDLQDTAPWGCSETALSVNAIGESLHNFGINALAVHLL